MCDYKKLSIVFLIQCYFGDVTDDPILAAIDKAYIDMQTHTVKVEKGRKKALFKRRKIVTEVLHDAIKILPEKKGSFDEWHKSLTCEIQKKDNVEGVEPLTIGQIQKWINMAVKYCFVLKQLGIDKIDDYFNGKNAKRFHAPLDSYVLKAIDQGEPAWSSIKEYDHYKERIKKVSFCRELEKWPEWANKAKFKQDGEERKADKGTYKRYIQDGEGYNFKR